MPVGLHTCLTEDKLVVNEMEVDVWKFGRWKVTFSRSAVATSTASFYWKQEEH